MSVCDFFINNLSSIGLAFDIAGAGLMVGHRLPVVRRIGFVISRTNRQRRDAFKQLLDGNDVVAGADEFSALQERLFPQGFIESQLEYGGNIQYDRFHREEDQIVLHIDEIGPKVPSYFDGHNLRRDVSQVGDSLERSFEQLFLYIGIVLLVFGFSLQLYANLFLPK